MPAPTVLVVDPNPATLRRVEEALAELPFQVRSARDGDEALAMPGLGDVAVVIAAASLPKGSGYDFARVVRDRWPAAALVLMTGGFEVYHRTRAAEAGVGAHLAKPFTVQRLRSCLEDLIGPMGGDFDEVPVAPTAPTPPVLAPPVAAPAPVAAAPAPLPRPPITVERVATFLPRDFAELPLVRVDPAVIGPELERAVLEVLPEVVEAVLRQALTTSPAFRDLVAVAVEDAVRQQLPALVTRAVNERLAELERAADPA
jgi:CheY-like chemotaxis protein